MNMKNIITINRGAAEHWVGDGFPVSTLFSYDKQGTNISPFLLLDYAGPADFKPSVKPRGVAQHPHRGFETVTIVYQGEVEHMDNAGNAGTIGPGDVQWMTAARGILHEEMHSHDFTRNGGTLEMIQLWVNLPAKHKMSEPHYQELLSSNIPVINLPNGAGDLRLIAGEFEQMQGAAKTFTPVNLWDVRLQSGHSIKLSLPDNHNASLLVLHGKLLVNGNESLCAKELAIFERKGNSVMLAAEEDTLVLLMSGEPIEEPIVGRGPFVMNTADEIRSAFNDFAAGLI